MPAPSKVESPPQPHEVDTPPSEALPSTPPEFELDPLNFEAEVLLSLARIDKTCCKLSYHMSEMLANGAQSSKAYGGWHLSNGTLSSATAPRHGLSASSNGSSARANHHGPYYLSASRADMNSDLPVVQEMNSDITSETSNVTSPPHSLVDVVSGASSPKPWRDHSPETEKNPISRLIKKASEALIRETSGLSRNFVPEPSGSSSLPTEIMSLAQPPELKKSHSVLGVPEAFESFASFKGLTAHGERISEFLSKPLKVAQDFALAQGWISLPDITSSISSRFGTTFSTTARVGGCGSCRHMKLVVDSATFDSICATLILANAIFLAVTTEYAAIQGTADKDDLPKVCSIGDYIFTSWFLVELLCRMVAVGPCSFWSWSSPNASWNYFDTVIVTMNVVETVMSFNDETAGANLTALRVMRILRVARALRVVRLVRVFRALRKMVLSILCSFTTLMWAIILLLMIIFVFGLFLTDHVTKHLYKDLEGFDNVPNASILKRRFGSLANCAYTLFLSVAGGVSWQEVSDPLFEMSPVTGLIFCFYIFFTVFAMLNIITGIFVDTAMSAAQNDKEECIVEQLHAQDSAIRRMQAFFEDADTDGTGAITFDAFNTHLSNTKMRAHLASLGIDTSEAQGLFRLLDLDNSGLITPEEFLVGCMRLKGNAKAIDVATLLYENKRMVQKWTAFMLYVEKQFKIRHAFEGRQEERVNIILSILENHQGGKAARA